VLPEEVVAWRASRSCAFCCCSFLNVASKTPRESSRRRSIAARRSSGVWPGPPRGKPEPLCPAREDDEEPDCGPAEPLEPPDPEGSAAGVAFAASLGPSEPEEPDEESDEPVREAGLWESPVPGVLLVLPLGTVPDWLLPVPDGFVVPDELVVPDGLVLPELGPAGPGLPDGLGLVDELVESEEPEDFERDCDFELLESLPWEPDEPDDDESGDDVGLEGADGDDAQPAPTSSAAASRGRVSVARMLMYSCRHLREADFGLVVFGCLTTGCVGSVSSLPVKNVRNWPAMRLQAVVATRAMNGSGTIAPMIAEVPVTSVSTVPADFACLMSQIVAS
jgi:hypothetical protein